MPEKISPKLPLLPKFSWAILAMGIGGLGFAPGSAQEAVTFGQNKVQYHTFHWSYYQTEHFDIYYTQGGERIAQFAARHVEEMYVKVSAMVGHSLKSRVPIILHDSHAEFEQTNVVPIPLDEDVGGFTEQFKNRIVLPFEGDYPEFYHVLKHEMTHAVVNDMLYNSDAGFSVSAQLGVGFPLWLNEGLAEYTSLGWDLGSEFFMIDATTFGYVESPTQDFGGFLAYKGGQIFLYYVDQIYGKGTVTKLLHTMSDPDSKDRSLTKAFQKVTHTSLEEAGEIWLRELRYLYWPELGQREYGKAVARKLTHHGKDHSFYNLQPSLSPNGEEIAFFSDRESWEAIYILNVKTEKVVRAVIQGGKQEEHESFHSFKSGIAWSPDGKSLAVVSKQEGHDVIHLLDSKNGKVNRVLKPDLQAILSPSWSRDGRYLAFSGQRDGFADIYVYDLQTDSLRRLTADIAYDDKPVFSPSGKWIAFESDRPKPILDPNPKDPLAWYDSLLRYKDIYRISISGDSLTRVVGGPWDEKMPAYGPSDSVLYFVSNRSGLDNIYVWRESMGTERVSPITNILTGCFTPSLSYDGTRLAFSLFEDGGWDIYLMQDPLKKIQSSDLPQTRFIRYYQDSAMGFFRPPVWGDLTSYKPDTGEQELADSTTQSGGDRNDSTGSNSSKRDSLRNAAQTIPTDSSVKSNTTHTIKTNNANKPHHEKPSPFLKDTSAYKDSLGSFISRPYLTKWGPDAINGSIGSDPYYGATGLAEFSLTDLMGDQRASFALGIDGSVENLSGFAEYEYLPYKPDFNVMAFLQTDQTSTSIVPETDSSIFQDNATDWIYGFAAGMRYPLSTFTRFEFESVVRFDRHNEELLNPANNVDTSSRTAIDAFLPSVSWVQDNAQWGPVGPVAGHRMLVMAQYMPPLLQSRYSYVKAQTDLRGYWEFFKRYTLAARVSAGISQAVGGYSDPDQFIVGGEYFTFNPHFNLDNIARTTVADYYFSDLDYPLRGYESYEFLGTRKFLTNFEFRFPFIDEIDVAWPLPPIRNVMGNLFFDYGGAWSGGDPLDQMGAGLGYGLRLNLGIFVLKYTYAQSIDGLANLHLGPVQYWSLGTEF